VTRVPLARVVATLQQEFAPTGLHWLSVPANGHSKCAQQKADRVLHAGCQIPDSRVYDDVVHSGRSGAASNRDTFAGAGRFTSFPVTWKCFKAAAARRGLDRRPILHAPVSTQLPGEVPQHRTLVLLFSGAVMIASEIANIAINVSITSPQPDLRRIAISTDRTCCRAADIEQQLIHWLVSQHVHINDTTSHVYAA